MNNDERFRAIHNFEQMEVPNTVGLRGKQNIFQICGFMGSGSSFKHK